MNEELTVWPRHIYATRLGAGVMCAGGARRWFAKFDINWSDFVANGVKASTLLNTGDELGRLVVEQALKMETGSYGG